MSNGPDVIIVNIILCNDECFTRVTIINNLLTYLYFLGAVVVVIVIVWNLIYNYLCNQCLSPLKL